MKFKTPAKDTRLLIPNKPQTIQNKTNQSKAATENKTCFISAGVRQPAPR